MSMDDPGWGEEVPDEPTASPAGATSSPKSSGTGGFQPSRNQLIIGGAVVVVIIVVLAIVLSSSKKTNSTTTTTTTNSVTSTTHPSTTTTAASESIAHAGTSYLALETPAYNSLTAFGSVVSGWDANPPTPSAAQTAANPTILEFKTFSSKLLAGTWPAAVQPQINTLASQVEVVANDLGDLGLAFSNNTQSTWSTTFENDANQLVTDANAVRTTLKLPALATS
jgi:predicted metalloprotease